MAGLEWGARCVAEQAQYLLKMGARPGVPPAPPPSQRENAPRPKSGVGNRSSPFPRLRGLTDAGLFRALRIPGTIPGGYPEYPDPLRGGVLTVVMTFS